METISIASSPTLSLDTEIDTWDPRADRISLLTLHAAKGLEFPVVFIAGCEEGLLPLTWGKPEAADLDEERRLFYVGVTRARTKLYLSRARKRLWRGKPRTLPPSPYLAAIEERLLERHHSRLPGKRTKEDDTQLDLFHEHEGRSTCCRRRPADVAFSHEHEADLSWVVNGDRRSSRAREEAPQSSARPEDMDERRSGRARRLPRAARRGESLVTVLSASRPRARSALTSSASSSPTPTHG